MSQSLLVSAFLKETKTSLILILTQNPTAGSFYFPCKLLPVISILFNLSCGWLLMVFSSQSSIFKYLFISIYPSSIYHPSTYLSILSQSAIYRSLLYVCKGKDASMCDSRSPWLELLELASEASKFSQARRKRVPEMKRNVLIPTDNYNSKRVQCPKELCKFRTAKEIKAYKDIQNLCTTKRNPSWKLFSVSCKDTRGDWIMSSNPKWQRAMNHKDVSFPYPGGLWICLREYIHTTRNPAFRHSKKSDHDTQRSIIGMIALQDRSSNPLLGTGCGKNIDGPVLDSKILGKIRSEKFYWVCYSTVYKINRFKFIFSFHSWFLTQWSWLSWPWGTWHTHQSIGPD